MKLSRARRSNGLEVFFQIFLELWRGLFPINFNSSWEPAVLKAELKREDCIGWYRNPDRGSQDSLGVIYEEAGENRILRPDFVFFVRLADGAIVADLVDPHGDYLADAMPKLKGLAKYAEEHQAHFRRIEAVSKTKTGAFRMLDLTPHKPGRQDPQNQWARALDRR